MKVKQVLIFVIAILLSTYGFFKFISFKKQSLSINSHLTDNSHNIAFSFQSQFSQYSIKNDSDGEKLFNDIINDLKLNTQGWSQFGTFDLVYPNKVEFIFADINLLSKQEIKELSHKHINSDNKFIEGIKSNFNQSSQTLTYNIYIDRASPNNTSNFSPTTAVYWSYKIIHMLCSCNHELVKNNEVDSKYQEIVDKFNLEFHSFFKVNNKQTSFLHSLLQKINIVQPVFAAGTCAGELVCSPEYSHYVCEDSGDDCDPAEFTDCNYDEACINRPICYTSESSFYDVCSDTSGTISSCYATDCPAGTCKTYSNECSWYPGAPPPPPPACGDGWCDVAGGETCSNCEIDCGACPAGDTNCDCCYWGGTWNNGSWCSTEDQCFVSKNPHDCNNGYSSSGNGSCADSCGNDPPSADYNSEGCSVTDVQCYMCDCYSPPPPPPPPATPIGYLDGYSCDTGKIWGWACDENNYATPLIVHVYIGGVYMGNEMANIERSGLGSCNGHEYHGFEITLPDLEDGQDHTIKVVAQSLVSNAWNTELANSPLTVNCPYPICGTIVDDYGEPINNLKIGVKDATTTYQYTTTIANGFFTISDWIISNGFYRVDPIEADFPLEANSSLKYLQTPLSTTNSYSLNTCDDLHTPFNSATYECQQMGNNDCSGPNAIGEKCRCNFTIPRNTIISGSFYLDEENDAAVNIATSLCEDITSTALDLSGIVSITASAPPDTFTGTIPDSTYTIDTFNWQDSTTVTLDLTGQAGQTDAYACSCPAPVDPYSYPWLCEYFNIPSPSKNVNFYLKNYILSHDPWLQIYGSNMYAASNINIQIPDICNDGTNSCQDAIILKDLNSTLLSSGFPLVGGTTVEDQTKIHLADDRDLDTAQYAFAANTSLSTYSFVYFYDKVDNLLEDYEEDSIADAADDTTAYFIKDSSLDLDIDSTIEITDSKKIIIFVDGNLTIDNTGNINELIKVESGSILMFIVSGDITFNANVGYSAPGLYPDDVFSNPAANPANVEGIYFADGKIIIQSNGDDTQSDRKFIGAGTFVAYDGFTLNRDYSDETIGKAWNNTNPTETFIYRPDFVVNFPHELKDFLSNWREVNPSWE